MTNKTKGRPPKPTAKRKRLHYSVWVSSEEKRKIDALVAQSNLPASQFFLTNVIDKPIKRPKKKTLPKAIVSKIGMLDKLAGILALSVLKTKDKAMLSENWQRSSQNIKWISQLIALWVFEDFDFPTLKKKLTAIKDNTYLLYTLLEMEQKKEESGLAAKLYHDSNDLLASFDKHYSTDEEPPQFKQAWEADFDLHTEIENIKTKLLKL